MSNNEINGKVKELRELKRMKDELEAMIEGLQDEIKADMTVRGTDTLSGVDWKITWKEYQTSRLDTTALRKALPELAAQFTKVNTYKRFSLT